MKDGIIMSQREMKEYRLALKVINNELKLIDFAPLISKSYRQAQRIVKAVRDMDFIGVLHGNYGKSVSNKLPIAFEQQIMQLLKTKYQGFNLTHFREMLLENEGIIVKKTTLEKWAKKHGLTKHRRRNYKTTHPPRPRLPQEGMLVQFDGSPHLWFGGIPSTLIVAIDDATGKILAAEFFKGETSMGGLKIIREIVDEYGIPEAFYFDQAGIYGKVDRDWTSQIARALEMIHCKLFIASSPQAKGRVERVFRTLQDRLISELAFRGIKNFIDANKFLKDSYIHMFNKQFKVEAENPTKAYLPNVFGDLELIFCRKEQRKINEGQVFSYGGRMYFVDEKTNHAHRLVNINTHLGGKISFDIMGRVIKVKEYKKNIRQLKAG